MSAQATVIEPTKLLTLPENIGGGEIKYGFFKDTGFRKTVCVFTSTHRKGPSSVNIGEHLIHGICKQENLHWSDVIFCDLHTHLFYDLERGCYTFDILTLNEDPMVSYGIPLQSGKIAGWHVTECPISVFESFKSLIGPFVTLHESISRNRACYKKFTDEKLNEEMRWAVGYKAEDEEKHQEWLYKNKKNVYTPEYAFKMGYRFAPSCCHLIFPSLGEASDGKDMIYVNVADSHLLGQHSTCRGLTVFQTPFPITLWEKRVFKNL